MPGLLTHLIVAFVGFWIVFSIFHKNENRLLYGLTFPAGHIIPDTIKFGFPGIKLGTISHHKIPSDSLFWTLDKITGNFYLWIFVFVLILIISFILYKSGVIKFKIFKVLNIATFIFLTAIIIHLIMDIFIIETNYLI